MSDERFDDAVRDALLADDPGPVPVRLRARMATNPRRGGAAGRDRLAAAGRELRGPCGSPRRRRAGGGVRRRDRAARAGGGVGRAHRAAERARGLGAGQRAVRVRACLGRPIGHAGADRPDHPPAIAGHGDHARGLRPARPRLVRRDSVRQGQLSDLPRHRAKWWLDPSGAQERPRHRVVCPDRRGHRVGGDLVHGEGDHLHGRTVQPAHGPARVVGGQPHLVRWHDNDTSRRRCRLADQRRGRGCRSAAARDGGAGQPRGVRGAAAERVGRARGEPDPGPLAARRIARPDDRHQRLRHADRPVRPGRRLPRCARHRRCRERRPGRRDALRHGRRSADADRARDARGRRRHAVTASSSSSSTTRPTSVLTRTTTRSW